MIRVLAIDDEPLALRQLAAYLKKVPFFELVDSCQSALDAIKVLDGQEMDAIDYLLKPFGMGDILRAADKVKRQYDLMHTVSLSPADEDDALFLKTEYKVVRILIHDIIYVEEMAEYLRIHLAGQDKPIVVLLSMKKMEERLPSPDFMRIHKSYIINLHHIAEINKSRVVLDNEKDIPIGDSYREKLNDYINQKFLGK